MFSMSSGIASSVALKANHSHVNAGCEDNFCCLRVNAHVKLGHDAKVSAGRSAAHHNNTFQYLTCGYAFSNSAMSRTKRHQRGFSPAEL